VDRRQLRDFDAGLLGATLLLVSFGIVMVYSATHGASDASLVGLPQKQALFAIAGLIALATALFVSQDTLEVLSPFIYGLALALLVAVLIVGVGKTGEKRWFEFGPVRLQPSELAKYATVFLLARWLARKKTKLGFAFMNCWTFAGWRRAQSLIPCIDVRSAGNSPRWMSSRARDRNGCPFCSA